MKNKIKLLFILCLTLFGFGMLFNEEPSIVEADAATSISEDVVSNVKATPMTKEIESQSDSNIIDEINIDVIDEIYDYYYHTGSFNKWYGNEKAIISIPEEEKVKYTITHIYLHRTSLADGTYTTTTLDKSFLTNYSYKIYVRLSANESAGYLFGEKDTVTSSNENISFDYPSPYQQKFIVAYIDLGELKPCKISNLQFSLLTNIQNDFLVGKNVHQKTTVSSNAYIKVSTMKNFGFNGSCIVDENKEELSSTSKYEANKTYYAKSVFVTGTKAYNTNGYAFDKDMECPGFELEFDETCETLTVYYEFVPTSNAIEEFKVILDTDKIGTIYPGVPPFGSRPSSTTLESIMTSGVNISTITKPTGTKDRGFVAASTPLSDWDWTTNPVNTNNVASPYTLEDGVYAGFYTTFRTYTNNYKNKFLSKDTVVKVVDKNGNPIENVYCFFYESSSGTSIYTNLVIFYDLGQCKRTEVEEVEITVSDADYFNKFTTLYPGSSFSKLGYNASTLKSIMSLTGSSVDEQELIDNIRFEFDSGASGIYTTSEDPSSITSINSWNVHKYSSDYFIENQQFAIIYKVYLYSGQNVDKKYNFIEGMDVNFVDKDGNKMEDIYAYTLPYYYNGTKYAHQFYLVFSFNPVKYAGVIEELEFGTSEGVEWPTELKPNATLQETFPGITQKYNNNDYNIVTSSTPEVVTIYQKPNSSEFNYNNISPDMGIGSYYMTDSDGYNIYSMYDAYYFGSGYNYKLQAKEEYVYGFVIELTPGYRLSYNVELPENYELVYSLVDEVNRKYPSNLYGYSKWGSSQLYWIIYTIGTPEYEKVTNLGISFNKSLLSNVELQHGNYKNIYDCFVPNFEFVTYSNKVGFTTYTDQKNESINEDYDGNIEKYWASKDEEYLYYYGIKLPENNKYINDGYWSVYDNGFWQEPEWIEREAISDNYSSYYEFMLIAGETYGFYYTINAKDGYVFDLDVISKELEAAGFVVDYERNNEGRISFGYVVGEVTKKALENIDVIYDEELEPTTEELAIGNIIPEYVKYDNNDNMLSGILMPATSSTSKVLIELGIVVHNTKTPEFVADGAFLAPGTVNQFAGHAFVVAFIGAVRDSEYILTKDTKIVGIPADYTYEVVINEEEPERSYILVYKYLGEIKEQPIEIVYNEELEPTIEELAIGNTVPQYVDYEIGKGFIYPASNSESKVFVELGIVVHNTKTPEFVPDGEFLAPGSVSKIAGHVFAVALFGPGYDYEFSEDMEIVGIPEDYTYEVVINEEEPEWSYILVYKYLGEIIARDLNGDKAEISLVNKLTYNGEAQTQEVLVKYDGVTLVKGTDYTVTGNVNTNAGSYTLTVTGIDLYEGTVELEYAIAKVKVALPEATSFVYDGTAHTAVASHNLYTVEGATQTNAGSYEATVTLKDTANYEWAETFNGKVAWEITKATYDMSGVKFENVTVPYDGAEHKVVINGTLPAGVTVTYENNVGTNVGVYNAIAKFTGDANYNAIPDMNAVLTIKTVSMSFDTNKDDDKPKDVIVTAPEGIDPNKELYVERVEMEESDKDFSSYAPKGYRVGIAYDVKLLKDGVSVQPDGTLVIKMLIPEELKGKNFSIMHIHNDGEEVDTLKHEIDGDYVIVKTNKLSEFVFVYEMGSLLWIAIVLAVIAMLEGAFLVFMMTQKNKFRTKKLAVVYPPFVFGMFVPEWHIVLIIVFAIIVAALAAVDIVYALSFFGFRSKANSETEEEQMIVIEEEVAEEPQQVVEEVVETEPVVEESTEDDDEEDVMQVWDEETHSFTIIRIIKSFTARLIQSKDEVKDYYDIIKNELLSYKKVKSRISFKHEAFKFGKDNVARLRFRGKTLCLYLALNPADYENTKYKIEDMSAISNSSDVPTMYRINLPRRADYAKELIYDLMKKLGAERMDIDYKEYSKEYPYEDNEALLEKGLIKKSVKVIGNGTPTKTIINPVNIVKKVSASEVNNLITDEQVVELIEQSTRIADKTKKTIINIDTLSQYFNENETVTLEEIKKRIPNVEKKATYYKVLARGILDKPLTVDADDFSIEAEKMIIVTGGKVLVSKAR